MNFKIRVFIFNNVLAMTRVSVVSVRDDLVFCARRPISSSAIPDIHPPLPHQPKPFLQPSTHLDVAIAACIASAPCLLPLPAPPRRFGPDQHALFALCNGAQRTCKGDEKPSQTSIITGGIIRRIPDRSFVQRPTARDRSGPWRTPVIGTERLGKSIQGCVAWPVAAAAADSPTWLGHGLCCPR